MNAFIQRVEKQDGQGLVEYTLIVFLIAFVFWVAIKDTTVGTALTNNWNTIFDCVSAPLT